MKRLIGLVSLLVIVRVLFAGGTPNPGTPPDRRKKVNNPNAGKSKGKPAAQSKVTKAVTPVKKK